MADGQAYTHDEFVMLLTATLGRQLKVIKFNLFNFTCVISIQSHYDYQSQYQIHHPNQG
jgi:hypothetical protein